MNRFYIILLSVITTFICNAQVPDWQWARHGTGVGTQETLLASTDPDGNAYLAGNFQNAITFGSTTATVTGVGMYLAKFDPAGNLIWLRSAGGNGSNGVYLVSTDKDANTYITGRFANQVTFGAFTLTSTVANIYHIYVAKYDSSGNVLWVRSAGETGNGYDMTWALHVDAALNVYISGYVMSDTIPLDSDTLFAEGGSFCLIKYDSSGQELWSRNAKCPYFALSQNMTSDSQGNIYITGYFSGDSIVFGNTALVNQGLTALHDIFFASYDASGNFRWAKGYGGTTTDEGYGLAADHDDNIYLTGTFTSTSVTFDTYALSNPTGQYNYFLAKYNMSGNLLWLQSDSGSSAGYSIAIDNMNNLYWTGRFYRPSLRVDTMTLQRPVVYSDPSFIAKLDSSGHIFWAKVLASGGDDANGASLGKNGDIYFSGDFYNINPFVVGDDSLPLTGTENAFIAKLGFNNVIALLSTPDHVICPGTCTDFYSNSVNATDFEWHFPGSSTPVSFDENPVNICYNNPGQYDVTLIAGNANDADTLTLANYITVYPYPPPQGILQNGDTLFANPGAVSYQWYYNGVIIPGATGYFHIAALSGDYNVIATDVNGCPVEAAVFNVVAGLPLHDAAAESIVVYPNPASEKIHIENLPAMAETSVSYSIFNPPGELVMTGIFTGVSATGRIAVDISALAAGSYWIEIDSEQSRYRLRFAKY